MDAEEALSELLLWGTLSLRTVDGEHEVSILMSDRERAEALFDALSDAAGKGDD